MFVKPAILKPKRRKRGILATGWWVHFKRVIDFGWDLEPYTGLGMPNNFLSRFNLEIIMSCIQQYALDFAQCLPPAMENVGQEKSNSFVTYDAIHNFEDGEGVIPIEILTIRR
ncbi:hypothetical protein Fmac_028872 [Flemingia macrophylla]|uniref:Uncharacterized protein n=1 Tax=Flemingia macrophylla TaxID=520843 RepID=A0ABD1L8R1_9FABA